MFPTLLGRGTTTGYHPLLLFNSEGDCLAAKPRPGSVHSADDWEELLRPEIERQQKQRKEVAGRADAAFAKPEIYEAPEERDIAELLPRPVGESGHQALGRVHKRGMAEQWIKAVGCILPTSESKWKYWLKRMRLPL